MLDEISQAVLAREEGVKYLRGGNGGEGGAEARERVHAYLDGIRTTQPSGIYRGLQHPLYPILRKIERIAENLQQVFTAARGQRIVYVSNPHSHIHYLVQPLRLDHGGAGPAV